MADNSILIVDDDQNIIQVLKARLNSAGYQVESASNGAEALDVLRDKSVDLIVSDVKMPGMGGEDLLREVQQSWPEIPVILLTAFGSIPDAVSSIHIGAADYLTKPFDGRELLEKIDKLLELKPENIEPARTDAVSQVLLGGKSPVMRQFQKLVARVAPANINVLVMGESGTGKEMVARLLHDIGPRAKGPYVVVDCGSTPATLLESELFGHVKGSFTHAMRDKKGLVNEADGGVLFLDEIGNISPEMQTRLLRFLQEGTIRRIGDTKEIKVSCRVVAATNSDLPELVRQGDFREDLYFRLKVMTLRIPPLRDRKEDIPLLAENFMAEFCNTQGRTTPSISADTMKMLMDHSWPGNVRELRHTLEAGLVFCDSDSLMPQHLQIETSLETPESGSAMSLEDTEHKAIIRALEQANWVKSAAADILGISRRAIHYKINKYGITPPKPGE